MARLNDPIEPMTLGNMRANGVRSLAVSRRQCQYEAALSADRWPDLVLVQSFGPHMVRTRCGTIGDRAILLDAGRPQPGEAVAINRTLPSEKFLDRQHIAAAGFFEREEPAANGCNHFGLPTNH